MCIEGNVFIVIGVVFGLGVVIVCMIVVVGGKLVLVDFNEEVGSVLVCELGGVFVCCDVSLEDDVQVVVCVV